MLSRNTENYPVQASEQGYTYEWVLQAAVSILLSFLFLIISVYLLRPVVSLPSLPFWVYIFIAGVGVSEVGIGTALIRKRAGFGSRLREFILTGGVFYVLISLGKNGSIVDRLNPDVENIYPTVVVLLMWILLKNFNLI